MEKKPYVAPTVTNFGSIVEETKGFGGVCWEFQGLASFYGGGNDPKTKND